MRINRLLEMATPLSWFVEQTTAGQWVRAARQICQHRIRHYGFFGNGNRAANIAWIRDLLGVKMPEQGRTDSDSLDDTDQPPPCPRTALPVLRRLTANR